MDYIVIVKWSLEHKGFSFLYVEASESSESVSSSESEEEEVAEEEEEGVREETWIPRGARRALGEWEKHTTVRVLEHCTSLSQFATTAIFAM